MVVIGSGFGGSITACRLAQAGRHVCVLERGRRWSNVDFPRSPSQIARNAFWDPEHGRFGLLDYRVFSRMQVIQGCGVGGGSLHYFNVHLSPPAAIFKDPRWPAEIDLDTLAPYYGLAADMLDAAPLSPPAGRSLPTRTTAFLQACKDARHPAELVPLAVYTGPGRRIPHGRGPPAAVRLLGRLHDRLRHPREEHARPELSRARRTARRRGLPPAPGERDRAGQARGRLPRGLRAARRGRGGRGHRRRGPRGHRDRRGRHARDSGAAAALPGSPRRRCPT